MTPANSLLPFAVSRTLSSSISISSLLTIKSRYRRVTDVPLEI